MRRYAVFLSLISLLFIPILLIGNFTVDYDSFFYTSEKVTKNLNGFKIAQISDFHNNESNLITDSVIERLKLEKPDIIVITGDFIDSHSKDVERSLLFAEQLVKICPVYFVDGNHEINIKLGDICVYNKLIDGLRNLKVNVLNNGSVFIEYNGEKINLIGLSELYSTTGAFYDMTASAYKLCKDVPIDSSELNILLAHHPEQLPVYAHFGFDAVFSGHAHGGQVRIFGIGIFAPNQGLFPNYSGGEYTYGDTVMYLSRGLGNSVAPIRFFDRPNVIICTLSNK